MKKKLLSFVVALSAAGAWGYSVNSTHGPFYFEEFTNTNGKVVGEVKNRNTDGAGWLQGNTIDNVTNHTLTATSQPNFYRIIIQKPGVAVKAWGLSTSQNIANANWLQNTASTNFLCAYDSAYATVSTVYLINTRFLEKYYQQLLQTTAVPTATPKKRKRIRSEEVRFVISISCFTAASNRQLSGSLWKRTRLPMQPFRNTNRRKGTSGQRRH